VLWVEHRTADAVDAMGLVEYVEKLMNMVGDPSLPEEKRLMTLDKAIKAMVKAYSLHDLPYYTNVC
jgi:hypothetical protein